MRHKISLGMMWTTILVLALVFVGHQIVKTQLAILTTVQPVTGYTGTGSVAMPVTGPLTDTLLRATPVPVSISAINVTADTPFHVSALSTTVQTVSGSAIAVGSFFCGNANTTMTWVQFFNTTGSVTLGTTVPDFYLAWSGNNAAANAGAADRTPSLNLNFSNGLKVAATTTALGNTAPSNAIDCAGGKR